MNTLNATPPSNLSDDRCPPDDAVQTASSGREADVIAQFVLEFNNIASQASLKSQEAADAAEEALLSATELITEAREMPAKPAYIRDEDLLTHSQHLARTKFTRLQGEALFYVPLVVDAAELADSYSDMASRAASNVLTAERAFPMTTNWEHTQQKADEAAGHARRASAALDAVESPTLLTNQNKTESHPK